MRSPDRLHALDALRAFALLMGIVLHATMSFMPGLTAFGFPADSSQSMTLQTVFYVIHIFRMSLFFFIAGYFAHLMFHRKGGIGFVRDRLRRILLPFLLGWLFFGPIAMALIYFALAPSVTGAPAPLPNAVPLTHLWFLYYLMLFYGATLAIRVGFVNGLDRNGEMRARLDGWIGKVVRLEAAPLLLALPVGACLYFTFEWWLKILNRLRFWHCSGV